MVKRLIEEFVVAEKHGDEGLKEFRESECNICPFNRKGICAICTCVLSVKVESYTNRTLKNGLPIGPIELTHCPKGKWADKETANFYRAQKGKKLID